MCVICVKEKGIQMPKESTIRKMFSANHDGAGYMLWKNTWDYVKISKGYMTVEDLLRALEEEKITKGDVIILHFRWGTQGGTQPGLTHPYPITDDYNKLMALDVKTNVGICHNGIIRRTTRYDSIYNDTMIFIHEYLCKIVKQPKDLLKETIQDSIEYLTCSKWASLDKDGNIVKIGRFEYDSDGLCYSNLHWNVERNRKIDFNSWLLSLK